MNKIIPGNGQKVLPSTPERPDTAAAPGSSAFKASVEQSRHTAEIQEKGERAPLPVAREEERKRRNPPVFETMETVAFEEALEIQRRKAGIARKDKGQDSDELTGQTVIAIIAKDKEPFSAAAEPPLLAYSTIFMDGRQYASWKAGTDPALDLEVSRMLAGLTGSDEEK